MDPKPLILFLISLTFNFSVFAKPGGLDSTFSENGSQTLNTVAAFAMVQQPDGKIVIAGNRGNRENADSILLRLNADGSIDTDFGSRGGVQISFSNDPKEAFTHLTLQSDGKIIAAGSYYDGVNTNISLVRLNSDGTLDLTFSEDGKQTWNILPSVLLKVKDLQLDAEEKIVLAIQNERDIFLARFDREGSLDINFGNGAGSINVAPAVDLQGVQLLLSDSNIGVVYMIPEKIGIKYFLPTGEAIPDRDQETPFEQPHQSSVFHLSPNGEIFIATSLNNGLLLERFKEGARDNIFIFNVSPFRKLRIISLIIQPDGKILLGGYQYPRDGRGRFVLSRLNPDGSFDSTFDGDEEREGNGIIGIGGAGILTGVSLQSDGKILVLGTALRQDGSASSGLLRLLGSECGNTSVEYPESCDDGNQTAGDGCENNCSLTPQTSEEEGKPSGQEDSAASDEGSGSESCSLTKNNKIALMPWAMICIILLGFQYKRGRISR